MQQIDCNPQLGLRESAAPVLRKFTSFQVSQSASPAETLFGAPNCDARCLFAPRGSKPARLPPKRRWLDRGRNRFLDLADRGAHARTPRLIDDGSARGLTGGLLCRFRIRHTCWTQELVIESGAYKVLARHRQRRCREHRPAAKPSAHSWPLKPHVWRGPRRNRQLQLRVRRQGSRTAAAARAPIAGRREYGRAEL
jgi:hypothetical protein